MAFDFRTFPISTRSAVLLCAIAGCGTNLDQSANQTTTVVVLAAASTKDALQEMAAEAEKSSVTPLKIEISTGPSHALAQQILSGAPADIYVSANRKWGEEIDKAQLSAEMVDWLSNDLVLVVPANAKTPIERLDDLTLPKVKRIAIAGENVPAGMYAQQALTYHKLWDDLAGSEKLVRGHDVRTTLAYVERGEVDAAIVYSTDARMTDQVRVVARFDPASHDRIVYPLVRIQTGTPAPAAERFFTFLQSGAARRIAEKYGFVALGAAEGDAR